MAHNFYRSSSPSGENRVVQDELGLLDAAAGIEAVPFFAASDHLSGGASIMLNAALTVGSGYSRATMSRLADQIDYMSPDILHVHNLYPMLGTALITRAHRERVAVVHTVHNYRHSCLAGTHFREGRTCVDCLGHRYPWPAVQHSCYRGSRAQSLAMASGSALAVSRWDAVDRWIALTPFMAEHLARTNSASPTRITIRPTWVARPSTPYTLPGRRLLFLGRLDESKGVRLLLNAWEQAAPEGFELCVAGAGPLSEEVAGRCAKIHGASFLGVVAPAEVPALLKSAAAVIVPSLWYEGFPRTIVEAMSFGRPTVVSDQGSLSGIVEESTGWKCSPTPEGLVDVLRGLTWDECVKRGLAAKRRYELSHTPEAAVSSLLDIYRDAIEHRHGGNC